MIYIVNIGTFVVIEKEVKCVGINNVRTMDYEKLHKAALEIGEELIKKSPEMKDWVVSLLPELKESEDERIRKEIKNFLKISIERDSLPIALYDSWIAWLEKQGGQTPVDESEFKVGDWVVYDHRTYQIAELPQGRLINASLSRNGKTEKVPLPYCEKWSIQDAKDGDVLSYENEIFIVKKSVNLNIIYYCCYDREHFIIDSIYSLTIDDIDNIKPATKEQCDLLFQKMKEAGYKWENNQLEKIKQ